MANIIITGANQGIGYYFTEQALKDGNRVAVLDIETDHLKDLAQVFPKQLLCCKADVCDDMPHLQPERQGTLRCQADPGGNFETCERRGHGPAGI